MRMASCALPCIRPLETSASLDSHDVKATKSLDDRLTHLPISLPGDGVLGHNHAIRHHNYGKRAQMLELSIFGGVISIFGILQPSLSQFLASSSH